MIVDEVLKRLRWIEQALSASRAPFVLALMPVLLIAHSFDDGWYGDDFVQRTWLADSRETNARAAWLLPENAPPSNRFHYSMFELFNFADGGERVQHWIERGVLPWWTHPELRIRFFRPISGVTHWLDYTLWPGSPFSMHLHNALWLFAMASIAIFTFRLFLPSKTALLAGVFFALNNCLAGAAWIAGRNALIGATFVFATLYCHHRWRTGDKRLYIAALLSFIAALFSSESGVTAFVFVLSYSLFLECQTGLKRLLLLLPYLAIAIVWKLLYWLMGYGVQYSGLYVDPLNMSEFFFAVIQTYPALLQSLVISNVFHDSLPIGLSIGGLFFLLAIPLVQTNPTARFFLFATLLSLLPLCAHRWGANIERLFYIPAFGLSGLLAVVLVYWHDRLARLTNQFSAGATTSVIVISLLGLSAVSMVHKTSKPSQEQHDLFYAAAPYNWMFRDDGDDLFLFGTPNSTWNFYYPFLSAPELNFEPFSPAYTLVPDLNYEISAAYQNQIVLTLKEDWNLSAYDSVWRARESFYFEEGQRISAGDLQVVVLEVNQYHRPKKLLFTFLSPITIRGYYWRQWRLGRWNPMPIGAVE